MSSKQNEQQGTSSSLFFAPQQLNQLQHHFLLPTGRSNVPPQGTFADNMLATVRESTNTTPYALDGIAGRHTESSNFHPHSTLQTQSSNLSPLVSLPAQQEHQQEQLQAQQTIHRKQKQKQQQQPQPQPVYLSHMQSNHQKFSSLPPRGQSVERQSGYLSSEQKNIFRQSEFASQAVVQSPQRLQVPSQNTQFLQQAQIDSISSNYVVQSSGPFDSDTVPASTALTAPRQQQYIHFQNQSQTQNPNQYSHSAQTVQDLSPHSRVAFADSNQNPMQQTGRLMEHSPFPQQNFHSHQHRPPHQHYQHHQSGHLYQSSMHEDLLGSAMTNTGADIPPNQSFQPDYSPQEAQALRQRELQLQAGENQQATSGVFLADSSLKPPAKTYSLASPPYHVQDQRDTRAYQSQILQGEFISHDDSQPTSLQQLHYPAGFGRAGPSHVSHTSALGQQDMQSATPQELSTIPVNQIRQNAQYARSYPEYNMPSGHYDQPQGYSHAAPSNSLQRPAEHTAQLFNHPPAHPSEGGFEPDPSSLGALAAHGKESLEEAVNTGDMRQHSGSLRLRPGTEQDDVQQQARKRARGVSLGGISASAIPDSLARGRYMWSSDYALSGSEYDGVGPQTENDGVSHGDPSSIGPYLLAPTAGKVVPGVVASSTGIGDFRGQPSSQENIDSSLIDRLRNFNPVQGVQNVGTAMLMPPAAVAGGSSSLNIGPSVASGSVGGPSHGYHHGSGIAMAAGDVGAPARPFACKFCSATFGRRDNMAKHVRAIHHGERPYACDICHFRFQKKDHCQKHVRIVHFKERPYACEQCGSRFGQKSDLNKHLKTVHEKVKPYSCEHCGLTFGHRGNMLRHRSVVHEKRKPFECPECNTSFGERSNLTKHARAIHGISI